MCRLLLVEDEPSQGFALKALLESAGHEVEWAQTQRVATAMCQAMPFDALVIDYFLDTFAGQRGTDLYAAVLKSAKHKPPAVLMTSASGSDLAKANADAKSMGMRVISKPFECQQLLAIVGEILA